MLQLIYDNGRYVGPADSFEKSKKTAPEEISQDDLRLLFEKYQRIEAGLKLLEDPQRLIEPEPSMLQAAACVRRRIGKFGIRLDEGYVEEQKASIEESWNLLKPYLDAFRSQSHRVEAAMLEVDCA